MDALWKDEAQQEGFRILVGADDLSAVLTRSPFSRSDDVCSCAGPFSFGCGQTRLFPVGPAPVSLCSHCKFLEVACLPSSLTVAQGGSSLCLLILLSCPLLRKPSYEIFLRTHQALAAAPFAYLVWWHLPADKLFP